MNSGFLARMARDTRYIVLGFPLAVIAFALVLVGLAVGFATSVLFVGLLLLSATLITARGPAHLDRIRLSDLYGRPVVRLPYRAAPSTAGPVRRLLNPLTCSRSWLDALHALLRFPVSVVAFVITVLWWTLTLGGLLYPLWGWSLYLVPGYTDVGHFILPEYPALATLVVYMVGGALFGLTLPMVLRGLAQAESALGRALLLAPHDTSVQVLTAQHPDTAPGGAGAPKAAARAGTGQGPPEQRFVTVR